MKGKSVRARPSAVRSSLPGDTTRAYLPCVDEAEGKDILPLHGILELDWSRTLLHGSCSDSLDFIFIPRRLHNRCQVLLELPACSLHLLVLLDVLSLPHVHRHGPSRLDRKVLCGGNDHAAVLRNKIKTYLFDLVSNGSDVYASLLNQVLKALAPDFSKARPDNRREPNLPAMSWPA